jgi:mono/diheme cytochrome c family protein
MNEQLASKWSALTRGEKVHMTDAELDALEAYLMTVPDGSEDDKNASRIASLPSGGGGYMVWLKK